MTLEDSGFDNNFMLAALKEARLAASEGEVPVGCVIVHRSSNKIIVRTHNKMQQGKNAILHAEILAINAMCQKIDDKNLSDYDIYVTLEPCTMCVSAISNARFGRLYYGASDEKQGAVENGVRFFSSNACFYKPEIYHGICSVESELLLKQFFTRLRHKE